MDETFGLIDCNKFDVSCERVFRPEFLGSGTQKARLRSFCLFQYAAKVVQCGQRMAKRIDSMTEHKAPSASMVEPLRSAPLNFKVSEDFRREFKTYAAQHNKKLNQLLVDAFAALKASHVD